jgi:putative oxidoreductase
MNTVSLLVGRILLAIIFLLAGISKISAYSGTGAYMASMGVSASLLPLVIALEIGGALALIIGWQTRWVAYALAAFSLVAALMFHFSPGDQMQMIMFMKNIGIVGGFILLAATGPGALSVDARRQAASAD